MNKSDMQELRRMATKLSRMAAKQGSEDERFMLQELSIQVTLTADRLLKEAA